MDGIDCPYYVVEMMVVLYSSIGPSTTCHELFSNSAYDLCSAEEVSTWTCDPPDRDINRSDLLVAC